MKNHREYIQEQIKKDPSFANDLAEAEFEVTLALQLARLREKRGLSQMELANRLGMKQPQIARLERGSHVPGLILLRKVLEELGGKLEIDPRLDIVQIKTIPAWKTLETVKRVVSINSARKRRQPSKVFA